MGRETGMMSTLLGLLVSPPLIISTKSVVVMEWKGIRVHVNCSMPQGGPPMLQSTCSCPSTPSPRLIRSKVSAVDLRRARARCSIRPPHCPCMSCFLNIDPQEPGASISRPLRDVTVLLGQATRAGTHVIRFFWNRSRPIELPYTPDPSYTGQPRAHGSKFQLSPSSWAGPRSAGFAPAACIY